MKYIIILLLTSILFSCAEKMIERAKPMASSGEIIMLDTFKSHFIQTRPIDIWLPESYNKNNKYAVIYMSDGQMLFDKNTTWNNQEWGVDDVVSTMINEATIKDCIVVGVHNGGEGRHGEYFPEKPFNAVKKRLEEKQIKKLDQHSKEFIKKGDISSDRYLKFLVTELKPYIDKTYSTHPDPLNTIIAGSSMGGLISMYAICEYPEIFGAAACISTHWLGLGDTEINPFPEAFLAYLKNNLPDPLKHKIYFDYGTENLDASYGKHQIKVDEIMKLKGFNQSSWMTKKYEGHDHSETSWNKRLHIPFQYLIGK